MSEETDQWRVKLRRRMRGIATFFLVVSVLGGLGSAALIAAGDQRWELDDLIGLAAVSIGLFFAALASWNGSRIGAIFVAFLVVLPPVAAFLMDEGFSAGAAVRGVIYFILAMIMLISAIQYRAASHKASEPFGGRAWMRWLGKALSGGVLGFLGFGFAAIAFGPPIAVVKGSELSSEQMVWLSEQGFLTSSERPLYAYSDGVFSMEVGGSLLTDEYVGTWWKEDGELQSYWIKLGEICEVKTENEGSIIQDVIYVVHGPGEDNWFQLWLSIEDNLHKQFVSRMKTINDRKMRPEIQTFCEEGRPIDWVEVATLNGISQDIVDGQAVPEEQSDWMREQEFLIEGEEILSFYSYGKFSISEEGSLLTDQYLGGWAERDGEVQSWWMELSEICEINRPENASGSPTALYRLVPADPDSWIDLRYPTRNGQADALVDRVLLLRDERQSDEQKASCQVEAEPDLEVVKP